jgi:hypothetical protein
MLSTLRRAIEPLTAPAPEVSPAVALKVLHHQEVTDRDLTPPFARLTRYARRARAAAHAR